MRRYRVEVAGRPHVIDVHELTAHEFSVTVGDEQFTSRCPRPRTSPRR